MLSGEGIVHEVRNDTFWNWQFDSKFLNISVLAALTTVFAFQLTASCYNILLGTKPRGQASACDIHKFLLSESATPLEIFAAVVRLDVVDRLLLKRDRQENMKIARRRTRVHTQSILCLLLLVLVAPTFSIVSILIVLERDEQLTFKEANFRGFALGVGADIIWYTRLTGFCDQIPLRLSGPATSLVQFSLCYDFTVILYPNVTSERIRLRAETTFDGQIKVSVTSLPSNHLFSATFLIDMTSERQLFRIQPVFDLQDAAKLVHDGQEKLAKYCDSAKEQNSPHDEGLLQMKEFNGALMASKDFTCTLGNREIVDVLYNLTNRIAPIEQDNMKVVNIQKISAESKTLPEYNDAGHMPFLARRSRNVNLLPLLMITFLSLILRFLTGWGFRNDLGEGVQAIVKNRLGIAPESSLLRCAGTISYNCNCQHHLIYDRLTEQYCRQKKTLQEMEQYREEIDTDSGEGSSTMKVDCEW